MLVLRMQNYMSSLGSYPGRIKKHHMTFVTSGLTREVFGHPLNLRFFGLKDHEIASLKIIP
jgi:hypothetical protein